MTPNKFNIGLFSATALLVTAGVSHADVYGKAHLSMASIKDDNGSAIAIASHSSRFGAKGSLKQDNDLEVIYKMEWQIDMADHASTSASTTLSGAPVDSATTKVSDHIKSRSQYVGVKGGFGEIRIGRDDSPYKKAGKKAVELFSDTYADYNNIVDKGQDTRADNSVSYSVKAGPGKLSLMYAAGNDNTTDENSGDATSFSYDMTIGAVRVALASQSMNDAGTAGNTETGTKLVVGYKVNADLQLGLLYENVKDDATLDDKNTLISAKYKTAAGTIKFAYGSKDQGLADDATMTALAFDKKLSKSTSTYIIVANGTANGLKDASKLAGDSSVAGVGLVVKF